MVSKTIREISKFSDRAIFEVNWEAMPQISTKFFPRVAYEVRPQTVNLTNLVQIQARGFSLESDWMDEDYTWKVQNTPVRVSQVRILHVPPFFG